MLIGLGVAVTIFFVLHDIGERTQRAALDAEQANSERFADVLSSRLVGLQTSMRSGGVVNSTGAPRRPASLFGTVQRR